VSARPRIEVSATVLDAPDPRALAEFYQLLLGWEIDQSETDWVTLKPPYGGAGLSFQQESIYVRPVWPAAPGEQQMMSHLDIAVDDLGAAVALAVEAGAVQADHQPQDDVRVMLDPAGHPFCLFLQDTWDWVPQPRSS
jgi:predicted enzyme related to lactoylglutathione lyase